MGRVRCVYTRSAHPSHPAPLAQQLTAAVICAAQAHGLCFSVQKGVRIPPSLRNMIKEAQADVGIKAATHGSLESWAKQV